MGKAAAGGGMLTVRQAAARLGLSESMVRKLIGLRSLPAHRFGSALRVAPADLEAYLARTRTAAG